MNVKLAAPSVSTITSPVSAALFVSVLPSSFRSAAFCQRLYGSVTASSSPSETPVTHTKEFRTADAGASVNSTSTPVGSSDQLS